MLGKFLTYWKCSYRYILPAVVVLTIALALPRFKLFDDRAASMLEVHLLLELFAVIVAILIAVVSWHDLEKGNHPDSGILLAGFSLVATLDLIHALAYDGMPRLVTENSTTKSIFFWLLGRTFVVITLLAVVSKIRIQLPRYVLLGISLLASAGLFWIGTFHLELLPDTYINGQGVTQFKRNYEYILLVADVLLALLFIYRSTPQNQQKYYALATSSLVMGIGEIPFSGYTSTSDFLNIFGHWFKVLSYAFLYQSVFVWAIRQPYQQVRLSEARFRALTDLSADWYWEQDANFRFTSVSVSNPNTRAPSIVGMTRWELPTAGVTVEQWQEHRKALARHEPFKDFVYQIERRPNEFRWLSTSGSPIVGEDGEFLGYRGVVTDITERKAAEQQIEFLAYHDALTGLPNRLLLQDRFEQVKAYAARTGHKVGLLFLDLDNFKTINDTLGHEIGDSLLKEAAARLSTCLRDTDTVSRQGGDEFLILLPELEHADDIEPVVLKIMERMQEPFRFDGQEISNSVSMGVAILPDDGSDFETLRRKTDMAMYRAKEAGRNTYRFFDEAMNVEATEHLVLRNGLRRALERDEFVLHYQPQVDLRTRAITGVEALLRWTHPDLGMVSPERFIPVAEESGLIVPIGEWVLREACRQAMAWQQAGLPALVVAVNLSAVQFKRGDVEQSVLRALEDSGLPPSLLELELTESILIQNAENVLVTVQRLKQLGVKVSIDDFGTGYSSLSYLKRFDIDKLKIDQSFVRDLATDPNDAAIVRAIIQMARSLNLRTIAEGVETEEMLHQLRAFQCDEAQGYYFARPMAAESIVKFMQDNG